MIKKLYLIGIGPGDSKYLTLEAYQIIKRLDLFFIPDKRGKKEGLTEARLALLKKVKGEEAFKVIPLPFPERPKSVNYVEKVKGWRSEKAKILKDALSNYEEREAGFLIWGDPAIYDGHIEIVREVAEEVSLDWEVIPGLSAFQVLAAKERISLTQLATPLAFHTPRTLRRLKEIREPTVVFLDNYETFQLFKEQDLTIHWGAYVGTEEEVLLRGDLGEIVEEIKSLRRKLKEKKGYIMEIYFLKPKEA